MIRLLLALPQLSFLKYDAVSEYESAFSSLLLALHSSACCTTSLHFNSPVFVPSASALASLGTIQFPDSLASLSLGASCWLHFEPVTQPSHSLALEMLARACAPHLHSLALEFDCSLDVDLVAVLASAAPNLRVLNLVATRRCALPIASVANSLGARLQSLKIELHSSIAQADWQLLAGSCVQLREASFLEHHSARAPPFAVDTFFSAWLAVSRMRSLTLSPALVRRMTISPAPAKLNHDAAIGAFLRRESAMHTHVFCQDPATLLSRCISD